MVGAGAPTEADLVDRRGETSPPGRTGRRVRLGRIAAVRAARSEPVTLYAGLIRQDRRLCDQHLNVPLFGEEQHSPEDARQRNASVTPLVPLATIVAMATEPLRTVRDHLSEVVDRVEHEHERVVITRNGREAISPEDLAQLEETLSVLSDPEAHSDIPLVGR
jgi:antitoxin YefM